MKYVLFFIVIYYLYRIFRKRKKQGMQQKENQVLYSDKEEFVEYEEISNEEQAQNKGKYN